MISVDYIGPLFDKSGYGEAARNNIAALMEVGVNVTSIPVSFEKIQPDLNKLGKHIESTFKTPDKNNIQVLHLTPENYPKLISKNKYNIFYTTWETSRLPETWIQLINMGNEVWVPSQHNKTIFKESGITIPITVVPHAFNKKFMGLEEGKDIEVFKKNPKTYAFYSVFQWLERKSPGELLKAYLTEFKEDEDVVLILKTYMIDPSNIQENQRIKDYIKKVKSGLHMDKFPKMLLVTQMLSREEMQALHRQGDCYVSPHKCEGFGIPIAEAMMSQNPVIVTPYGGPSDFVKDHITGYTIDYELTPVFGMPWPNYKGTMDWAQPSINNLRYKMRFAFENQTKCKKVGINGKEWIEENLSWNSVGKTMKERLEKITNEF